MGKDLYHTIFSFLENALDNHPMVKKFEKIETENDILYKIERLGRRDLLIRMCDAYCFTEFDYYNKPKDIDFIYMARPEITNFYESFSDLAYREGINIGKFGILMGILYTDNIKDYIPPERRKKEK